LGFHDEIDITDEIPGMGLCAVDEYACAEVPQESAVVSSVKKA
jgi:hypothetical protein